MTAFLHADPSAVRDPVPVMVRDAPDLTLMAAPSKSSLSSLAASSLSDRTTVPWTYAVTSVSLLQDRGAVELEERDRSCRIRLTPVVPFFTLMDPSAQDPVTVYTPASLMVRAVPSISYPEAVPDAAIPLAENVKVVELAGIVTLEETTPDALEASEALEALEALSVLTTVPALDALATMGAAFRSVVRAIAAVSVRRNVSFFMMISSLTVLRALRALRVLTVCVSCDRISWGVLSILVRAGRSVPFPGAPCASYGILFPVRRDLTIPGGPVVRGPAAPRGSVILFGRDAPIFGVHGKKTGPG